MVTYNDKITIRPPYAEPLPTFTPSFPSFYDAGVEPNNLNNEYFTLGAGLQSSKDEDISNLNQQQRSMAEAQKQSTILSTATSDIPIEERLAKMRVASEEPVATPTFGESYVEKIIPDAHNDDKLAVANSVNQSFRDDKVNQIDAQVKPILERELIGSGAGQVNPLTAAKMGTAAFTTNSTNYRGITEILDYINATPLDHTKELEYSALYKDLQNNILTATPANRDKALKDFMASIKARYGEDGVYRLAAYLAVQTGSAIAGVFVTAAFAPEVLGAGLLAKIYPYMIRAFGAGNGMALTQMEINKLLSGDAEVVKTYIESQEMAVIGELTAFTLGIPFKPLKKLYSNVRAEAFAQEFVESSHPFFTTDLNKISTKLLSPAFMMERVSVSRGNILQAMKVKEDVALLMFRPIYTQPISMINSKVGGKYSSQYEPRVKGNQLADLAGQTTSLTKLSPFELAMEGINPDTPQLSVWKQSGAGVGLEGEAVAASNASVVQSGVTTTMLVKANVQPSSFSIGGMPLVQTVSGSVQPASKAAAPLAEPIEQFLSLTEGIGGWETSKSVMVHPEHAPSVWNWWEDTFRTPDRANPVTVGAVRQREVGKTTIFNSLHSSLKLIQKNLRKSKGNEAKVNSALHTGDIEGKVYDDGELTLRFNLTNAEIGAYRNIRYLADEAYVLNHNAMVESATQQGIKYLTTPTSKKMVKVVSTNNAKGTAVVREVEADFNNRMFQNPVGDKADIVVELKDLSAVTSIDKYREGYLPIRYADKYKFAITTIDPKAGKLTRVGLAETIAEAKQMAADLTAKGQPTFAHKVDESGRRVISAHFFNDPSIKLSDMLDNVGLKNVEAALLQADPNLVPDQLRVIINDRFYSTLGANKTLGARANNRLVDAKTGKPAQTKMAFDAMLDYIDDVAYSAGYMKPHTYMVDNLLQRYKPLLSRLPQHRWFETIDPSTLPSDFAPMVAKFNKEKNFILYNMDRLTTTERTMKRSMKAAMDKVLEDNPNANFAARLWSGLKIDAGATIYSGAREADKIASATASSLQFMFSTAQFIIQSGNNVAALVSTKPLRAATSFHELLGVARDYHTLAKGGRVSKEGLARLKSIEQSGLFSQIDHLDLMYFVRGDAPTLMEKVSNKVQQVALAPVSVPHKISQMWTYLTLRNEAIEMLEKGTLKNLDGTTYKGAADTPEFNQIVAQKTRAYSLDESNTANIGMYRNLPIGKSAVQFWQFWTRLLEQQVLGGKFNALEKISVADRFKMAMGTATILGGKALILYPLIAKGAWSTAWLSTPDAIKDRKGAELYVEAAFQQMPKDIANRAGEMLGASRDKFGRWDNDLVNAMEDLMINQGLVTTFSDGKINQITNLTATLPFQYMLDAIEKGDAWRGIPFTSKVVASTKAIKAYMDLRDTYSYAESQGQMVDHSTTLQAIHEENVLTMQRLLGSVAPAIKQWYNYENSMQNPSVVYGRKTMMQQQDPSLFRQVVLGLADGRMTSYQNYVWDENTFSTKIDDFKKEIHQQFNTLFQDKKNHHDMAVWKTRAYEDIVKVEQEMVANGKEHYLQAYTSRQVGGSKHYRIGDLANAVLPKPYSVQKELKQKMIPSDVNTYHSYISEE